jgi:hypothetical protein
LKKRSRLGKADRDGLMIYEDDNCSAWDMQPDDRYVRRRGAEGEDCRGAQQVFIDRSQACP